MAAPDSWLSSSEGTLNLARDSARGVGSTAAGQLVLMGLQLLSVMLLARILSADDFGVYATLIPVIALMAMMRDFGFQTTIVQRSGLNQAEASAYFWLNFALSFTGALVIYTVVPIIAGLLKDPRLTGLGPVTSLAFAANGLSATHDALLRRNLKFGRVNVIRVTAYLVGMTVAITLGVRGFGPLALAWQQVAEGASLSIGTFLACRWVPSLPSRKSWKPAGMRLAGALVLGRVVDYLRQNVDRALIRTTFSATELGYYDRAYRIMAAPVQQAQGPLMAVALPALSRKRGSDGYAAYFLAFVRAITTVSFPLGFMGLVFPEEIVRLMLGDAWAHSAPILRGLSLMSLCWPLMNLCAVNFVVFENSRALVFWPAAACVAALLAFGVGIAWGAAGVATAYGLAFLLLSPFQILSGLKQGGIRPAGFWAACAPPFAALLIGTGLALLSTALMSGESFTGLRGPLAIGICLMVYVAVLFWFFDYHSWLGRFVATAFPTASDGRILRWLGVQAKPKD
jgi:PST family polysaccharide transporter